MIKIKRAAIKYHVKGRIFTGKNHAEVTEKVFKATGCFPYPEKDKFGFTDTKSRFLNPYEAANVAFNAGQIKKRVMELTSDMIKLEG
jgi:hypothetical protein